VLVIAIDVGGPEKIGWAASDGRSGSGRDLGEVLTTAATLLSGGEGVAIGFESPIWTPRREEMGRITGRRGGAETFFNRAWSAGAGCGVLAAGLGLMPWCFTQIAGQTAERRATTIPSTFEETGGGLFVWEAFVSGAAKAATHMDDASLALAAFQARSLDQPSDIPAESAVNLAVAALLATGWQVGPHEIGQAGHVVAVGLADAIAVIPALSSHS